MAAWSNEKNSGWLLLQQAQGGHWQVMPLRLGYRQETSTLAQVMYYLVNIHACCTSRFAFIACISRHKTYLRFSHILRAAVAQSGITLAQNFRATSCLRPGDLERCFYKQRQQTACSSHPYPLNKAHFLSVTLCTFGLIVAHSHN